jgi:hypothetical protein
MTGKRQPERGLATTSKNPALGVVGLELPPETPIKAYFSNQGAPKSAPFKPDFDSLLELWDFVRQAWPELTPEDREVLVNVCRRSLARKRTRRLFLADARCSHVA